MAEDKDELALVNMDVDVLQRDVLIVVGLVGFIYMFKNRSFGVLLPWFGFAVMVTVIHIIEYHVRPPAVKVLCGCKSRKMALPCGAAAICESFFKINIWPGWRTDIS